MKSLLALIPCVALTACVYSQHSGEHHNGVEISTQQVSMVESGKTTKQWVLANFGIPDRTQTEKDGYEVFEYISNKTQDSHKSFIFLFHIESEKDLSHKVTRVVMRDGIVERVVQNEK